MNEENDDVFHGIGITIKLPTQNDFLKVKETLTRIGVASKKTKTLYQTAHILHKRGLYCICHFKELFDLDGKETTISENDYSRRNTIAKLLEDWKLIEIIEPFEDDDKFVPISSIKIIPFKEKGNWTLCSKYTLGKNKKNT